MNLNPDTLAEESDEDRVRRQTATGVLGNGLHVRCRPFLDDPEVVRVEHRVACLLRIYDACPTCPHRLFTMVLPADRNERFKVVQCPRWSQPADRTRGRSPDDYVPTEIATCEQKPLDFCPSCPSRLDLVKLGVDKNIPGWYGRWARATEYENE